AVGSQEEVEAGQALRAVEASLLDVSHQAAGEQRGEALVRHEQAPSPAGGPASEPLQQHLLRQQLVSPSLTCEVSKPVGGQFVGAEEKEVPSFCVPPDCPSDRARERGSLGYSRGVRGG